MNGLEFSVSWLRVASVAAVWTALAGVFGTLVWRVFLNPLSRRNCLSDSESKKSLFSSLVHIAFALVHRVGPGPAVCNLVFVSTTETFRVYFSVGGGVHIIKFYHTPRHFRLVSMGSRIKVD